MYERILVPLDGSKTAEAALPYVEELVSRLSPALNVEVTLFQVVSSMTQYVVAGEAAVPIPYTEHEMQAITQKGTDYLEKAGEGLRNKGAIVKTKVIIGNAAEEIIKASNEINADLIAMSTHGRSGISRLALGSITDKVLRGGNLPVLMVREPKDTANT